MFSFGLVGSSLFAVAWVYLCSSFSCPPSILQYVVQLFLCSRIVGFLVVLLAAQPHREEDQLLRLYTVLLTKATSLEHGMEGKSVWYQ